MRCTCTWTYIAALVFMLPIGSSTLSASDIDDADNALTITVTATGHEASTLEVSKPVAILDHEEVQDAQAGTLPEALRGQPGIFVQQTTSGQGAPIIRGLIGSSVLMMVDGQRLNNGMFRPAPNQYYALVDPWSIEKIEVVRGPGSALYGSDAMGGVVNVKTTTPRFKDPTWENKSRYVARYASAEDAWLTRYGYQGGRKGLGVAGGLTFQSLGDREVGDGRGKQHPSAYDVRAADLKTLFEVNNSELTGGMQYLTQPGTPRFDELNPGFGQTNPSSSEFSFEPNSRLFLHGSYTYKGPYHFLIDPQVHISYQKIDDDRRTRDFWSDVRFLEENESVLTSIGLKAGAYAGNNHQFTYGVDVLNDEILSERVEQNLTTNTRGNVQSRFANGSKLDSVALYIQDEWVLTGRLITTFNLRYSYFDIDIPAADRGVGVNNSFDDLTGGLGVSYSLNSGTRLVSNISRGFRAPNIFDFSTLGPRPGNRFNVPNTDLRPEEILSFDLGVKHEDERLAYDAFIFYSEYTDKITDLPTGSMRSDGRLEVQSRNVAEVDIYGIEGQLTYSPVRSTKLYGALNWVKGVENAKQGSSEPASRIPPANLKLGYAQQFNPDWEAEIWIHAVDNQDRLSERDKRDPRINPAGTPGWRTLNLRTTWLPSASFRLSFDIENALDEGYREHASGIDAPGRNFILTLDYRMKR